MTRPQSAPDDRCPRRQRRIAASVGACLWLALALCAGAVRANDDPPGRVGRVTEVGGQGWLFDVAAGEWIALQRNRPLTGGDRVSVEGGGRVELRIGSTAVRLDGSTELEIRRLDDSRIEMQLHNGSAALRVRSPEVANEVEVLTVEGRFLPRRAGHYRIDRRDDTSFATAWSGEIRFEASDSVLNVPPGRRAEFWQEGPQRATHYTWAEIQRDEFSDWVARANREDDRTASTRYVSPEMTGWEDLDRYGRWDSHSEYGALWVPTAVVAGWAPYRYGHWAWVRPWGWSWVDDAPWGFAPFHYGRWVMFGGRWCWAPGRWVARPIYAPALVAWVGGPNVSVGVQIGGYPGPVVGWVPLAPREVYVPHYTVSSVYLRGVNAGHRHLHPPAPATVPTRPIMYTNQGVPGAVTVVPSNVLSARRAVAPAVAQVDPALRTNLATQPWQRHAPPPAPARAIAVPGGAVPATPAPVRPAAPGATATAPGAAPAVVDLRRERAPQGQTPAPQAPTTSTSPQAGAQGSAAPPQPPPARVQAPPPAQSAAPGRTQPEPGVQPDKRGRLWAPSLPAPVRVEPPRQAAPQPMPQKAPAAAEVQRAPQPENRGAPEGKGRAPDPRSNNPRNQMQ